MAYHTGPTIVTDGLVLCLDAADRNSYPGSGNTWNDLSGNGNATLYNTPTFDSSNGGSINFASAQQEYFLTSTSLFNVSNFSISFWFYLNTFIDDYINLFQHNTSLGGNYNRISIERSNSYSGFEQLNSSEIKENSFMILLGNDSGTLSVAHTVTSFTIGRWYNISVGFNGTTLKCHVDGNQEFSLNPSNYPSAKNSTFGSYPFNGNASRYLDGKISSFLVYTKSLSANEVQQNYNATKGRFGL